MKIESYELSSEADSDLEEIFDYTHQEFGFNQAVKYLTDLDAVFNSLIYSPQMGRLRREIRSELYSITEQEHVIFYRILTNRIRIVRVLHGSKDLPRNF